jgi:hypothetical protein
MKVKRQTLPRYFVRYANRGPQLHESGNFAWANVAHRLQAGSYH